MAYKANIPLQTDQISTSQADLLANFQEINTFVAIDHDGFGTTNAGKHKKATFPAAAAPGAVGATEVGLYAANVGANPELWINKTATQIPFTAGLLAAPGWTYLPSGIILKWGTGNVGTNAAAYQAFVAGAGIPVFAAAPTCIVSLDGGAGMDKALFVQASAAAGVTVYNANAGGGARTFYYLAIGY